jgi:ATP-dependent RNA helicase DOB1
MLLSHQLPDSCLFVVVVVLTQVSVALRGVGDVDLAGRFDDARERMKRGVVFAASLYL